MLKPEQVPDEVAWKLHDKLWSVGGYSIDDIRAAIAAALNAWPGMEQDQLFHGFTDGTHYFQPRLILPLPTEASDE